MVRDALRTYLTMASGLVEVPRQQAMRVAKALVNQGEATAGQAGQVAEDLIGTSRANRDALLQLIRYEVDRGLGRLGLATAEEVRELTERVQSLEAQVRELHKPAKATKTAPMKKSAAKKTATKSTAKKAGAPR